MCMIINVSVLQYTCIKFLFWFLKHDRILQGTYYIPILQYRLNSEFNKIHVLFFSQQSQSSFLEDIGILNNQISNVILFQVLHRNHKDQNYAGLSFIICIVLYFPYYLIFYLNFFNNFRPI